MNNIAIIMAVSNLVHLEGYFLCYRSSGTVDDSQQGTLDGSFLNVSDKDHQLLG
jgi:hypothetical protein